jgi:putative acetyltransferase
VSALPPSGEPAPSPSGEPAPSPSGEPAPSPGGIEVVEARSPAEYAAFGALVREYLSSLPFRLDFQDVDTELAALEVQYGPPGGAALLALAAGAARPVGTVGLRRFAPGVAELKRMYVRPEARRRGAGTLLARCALATARALGYEAVRLDTVAEMTAAIAIYRALGFEETAPYRQNPLPSARFFELRLDRPCR